MDAIRDMFSYIKYLLAPGSILATIIFIILGFLYGYWEVTNVGLPKPDIDSGWAALIGAILGSSATAYATVFVTNKQLRAQREHAVDERLFNVRKAAYASAITFFMHTANRKSVGIAFPANLAEQDKGDEILNELRLLSSDFIYSESIKVIQFFGKNIPDDKTERDKELKEINSAINKLTYCMKLELGTTY